MYQWKSSYTHTLRQLRNSKALKEKAGWSRNVGAGFIKEDITDIHVNPDKTITIITPAMKWTVKIGDLNLRETEEAIEWLEEAEWKRSKPS